MPVSAPTGAATVAPPSETAPPKTPATVPPSAPFPVVEARVSPDSRLAFHTDPSGAAADRFRLLRVRLREFWNAGKLKTLLITSPLEHDGKSTVTLNLAAALCERGKRSVVVVEADLHHSALTEKLGLTPWAGLADCLTDELIPPMSAIRRVEPLGWHLLPAGRPRYNAAELLQGPAFGQIIKRLSSAFDWILIDSPPAIALTDAISIQHHADGTLLVVRAAHTPREAVDEAVELLGRNKIVGIVLNGVEPRGNAYYRYRRYEGVGDRPED